MVPTEDGYNPRAVRGYLFCQRHADGNLPIRPRQTLPHLCPAGNCQDVEGIAPFYGHSAAQKTFDILTATTHYIHYLHDLKSQFHHCVLVGDKGYLSRQFLRDLFDTAAICLETPIPKAQVRRNQRDFAPFSPVLRKGRKRIETLFSQLCDKFMMRRDYAKSFVGFSTRILFKVTALTLIQWINQQNGNNINNLKIVIS